MYKLIDLLVKISNNMNTSFHVQHETKNNKYMDK